MNATRHTLRGYTLLLPAILVMTLCGVLPLAFVVYYSLHDTFGGNEFMWVGPYWFEEIIASSEFHNALIRSLGYSAMALAIEVPLGVYIALKMPTRGLLASFYIIVATIPLLTPSIIVGYLWTALTLPKAGLLYEALAFFGITLNMNRPVPAWIVLGAMDTWHWTGLVILLCYAGLRTIPEDYYRAARIDGAGRWAVFRHIQLPNLRVVLLVAILLRFMDSFIVYIEPVVVTGGGPGVSTTFLSHELVLKALVEFNLGEGAAMAIVYFLIVLCVSWAFFTLVTTRGGSGAMAR